MDSERPQWGRLQPVGSTKPTRHLLTKAHILGMRVLESFILLGRGLIVSTDEVIELPGTHRVANVKSPDGTHFQAEIIRSNSHNPDYLLVGVGKDDVPVGSMIDVS